MFCLVFHKGWKKYLKLRETNFLDVDLWLSRVEILLGENIWVSVRVFGYVVGWERMPQSSPESSIMSFNGM